MEDREKAWERWYSSSSPVWGSMDLEVPFDGDDKEILDVGCGTGGMLIKIASEGFLSTGIDLSSSALQTAEKRLRERALKAELIKGDVLEKSIEMGPFHGIVLHHILSSLYEGERHLAVDRCIELLREGGSIWFFDMAVGDIRFGKGREVEERTFLKGNGLITHFFDEREVKELFSDLEMVFFRKHEWTQRTGGGDRKRSRWELYARFS